MSASLVGSEMCIRDSCLRHPQREPHSPVEDLNTCPRSSLVVHSAARCAPVSYTHLTLPTICSV
eukprot:1204664-Alexandrium_andersonii.AAC.1